MEPLSHVRRNFINFLREYFSSGKIVDPNGGSVYQWQPDMDKTDILIQGANIEKPEILNKTPAIIVSRSDILLEQQYQGMGKSISSHDPVTGKSTYVDLYSCVVSLSCLSSNSEEAENLAHIVHFIIKMHRQYLMGTHSYLKLLLGAIGAPRIIKYEGAGTMINVNNCGVPINLTFTAGYSIIKSDDKVERIIVPFAHSGLGSQADGTFPPVITWVEDE